MVSITDEKLLELNKQGIIPGPGENEESFLTRAKHCLGLKESLTKGVRSEIPFVKENLDFGGVLAETKPTTQKLYDITPTWVPIFFSNYQLTPWHGGCAWIFQLAENGPLGAFLQLRKSFSKESKYLGLYSREELVSHELAHVGRMAFDEPIFEELHAYRASHAKWRRWLGPIVQSARESMLFMLLLLLIFTVDVYLILTGHAEAYTHFFWLKAVPAGMVAYALWRLWQKQKTFAKCRLNLVNLFNDENKANAVIYRLTDKEIKEFAQASQQQIKEYAEQHKAKSLRWRLLNLAYFS